jgi:hypothetical protein
MRRIANPINVPTTSQHSIGPAETYNDDRGLAHGRSMTVDRFQRGSRVMHAPLHEESNDMTWVEPASATVRSGNQDAEATGISEEGMVIGYGATDSEREMDADPEGRDMVEAGMGMTGEDKSGYDPGITLAKCALPLAAAVVIYLLFFDKDRVR